MSRAAEVSTSLLPMRIPQLGFGTWRLFGDEGCDVVVEALDVGYRHIDTAQMYGNEEMVGKAISLSGIPREEIWITTKLDTPNHAPVSARDSFARSLDALGVDHVDLFLMHWPLRDEAGFVRTWETMQEFSSDGRATHIGVSNFHAHHLEAIIKATGVTPFANQIEVHPYLVQKELIDFCHSKRILVEAWSPLGRGRAFAEPVIVTIAEQLGRTPAQEVLRWQLQRGLVVIPKSANRERIIENSQIFDFELTDDQMTAITSLHNGERIGPDPDERDQ